MRFQHVFIALSMLVLTATGVFALLPNYNAAYPTVGAFSYRSYTQPGTMYGYGTGHMMAYGSVRSGYSPVDGYRLTQYGPYPYPPNAVYAQDPQFRGHYDAWSGRYYDATTGRTVSQYPRYSGGMPAYRYPNNPYVINRYY